MGLLDELAKEKSGKQQSAGITSSITNIYKGNNRFVIF